MRKFALAMACLLWAFVALSQARTVTGTVTDKKDGSPLGGVSVTVSGSKTGVKTESNGTFSISVPENARTLNFSFVGFQPFSVAIPANGIVVVQLEAAASDLDEVVVVGYGTQKKGDVTGAVP